MNALYSWTGIQPVFLWTDLLIWLLVAVVIASVFYIRRRPHLRTPWQRVARSRMAMGSLVVLLLYVTIGLLDSIHFRTALETPAQAGKKTETSEVHFSTEVHTVLDWLVRGVFDREEKTYSAPLATHLYSKEQIEKPDGSVTRDFPRLETGGAHLENPQTAVRDRDVWETVQRAATEGAAIWIGFILLFVLFFHWRRRKREPESANGFTKSWLAPSWLVNVAQGKEPIPWRTILFITALLTMLVIVAIRLGMDYHILGTDKVGQDVFYQAIKGIRTGLVIGTLTTLIMLPFAVVLGMMAGYFRGWIDDVIQYIYTTLNAIPGVLLIAAAILMIQVYIDQNPALFETAEERADLRLLFLCIILGITSWTGLCRLLRGETLKLREMDYVTAAQAFGVGQFKILFRHILPNVMHVVLISIILDFSGLVLAEAVLSYVGVGVDPTMHSWGNMINSARLEMAREPMVWWTLLAAFLFMFTLVLAANLFSDVVRAAFDPRLQGHGEK